MSAQDHTTAAGTAVDPRARYYDVGGIETIDIVRAKLTDEQFTGYLLGTLLVYSCRLNWKGVTAGERARDAQKMGYYARWLREHLDAGVRDVDAAIEKHRAMLDEQFQVDGEDEGPKCVQCGCTELRACVADGKPCGWVWVNYLTGEGLCTACQEKDAAEPCGCPPDGCEWLRSGVDSSKPASCRYGRAAGSANGGTARP